MGRVQPGEGPSGGAEPPPEAVDTDPAARPVQVSMRRIVAVGMGLWAVALVVTLLVPGLHTGERSWWPQACLAGIALGTVGLAYLSRGRGNAADA